MEKESENRAVVSAVAVGEFTLSPVEREQLRQSALPYQFARLLDEAGHEFVHILFGRYLAAHTSRAMVHQFLFCFFWSGLRRLPMGRQTDRELGGLFARGGVYPLWGESEVHGFSRGDGDAYFTQYFPDLEGHYNTFRARLARLRRDKSSRPPQRRPQSRTMPVPRGSTGSTGPGTGSTRCPSCQRADAKGKPSRRPDVTCCVRCGEAFRLSDLCITGRSGSGGFSCGHLLHELCFDEAGGTVSRVAVEDDAKLVERTAREISDVVARIQRNEHDELAQGVIIHGRLLPTCTVGVYVNASEEFSRARIPGQLASLQWAAGLGAGVEFQVRISGTSSEEEDDSGLMLDIWLSQPASNDEDNTILDWLGQHGLAGGYQLSPERFV